MLKVATVLVLVLLAFGCNATIQQGNGKQLLVLLDTTDPKLGVAELRELLCQRLEPIGWDTIDNTLKNSEGLCITVHKTKTSTSVLAYCEKQDGVISESAMRSLSQVVKALEAEPAFEGLQAFMQRLETNRRYHTLRSKK
jgi:hypothetical protein